MSNDTGFDRLVDDIHRPSFWHGQVVARWSLADGRFHIDALFDMDGFTRRDVFNVVSITGRVVDDLAVPTQWQDIDWASLSIEDLDIYLRSERFLSYALLELWLHTLGPADSEGLFALDRAVIDVARQEYEGTYTPTPQGARKALWGMLEAYPFPRGSLRVRMDRNAPPVRFDQLVEAVRAAPVGTPRLDAALEALFAAGFTAQYEKGGAIDSLSKAKANDLVLSNWEALRPHLGLPD